MYVKILS